MREIVSPLRGIRSPLGAVSTSLEALIRAQLFSNNEPGYILDPSDFSTMFQDAAGSQPVTAVGQSVRRMLDKSGRGNHFTQANVANAPILGREPRGGRRNLLLWSEDLSNAVWGKLNVSATANTLTAVGGVAFKNITQNLAASATGRTISLRAEQITHRYIQLFFNGDAAPWANIDLQTGTVGSVGTNQTVTVNPHPSGGFRITLSTPSASASNVVIGFADLETSARGSTAAATGSVLLTDFQSETGSTATPYQRVTTAFDVTEAGVPTVHYLQYDGTDDWLQSVATINPGAVDKVQVFAGVRKLSDAAGGIIAEASAAVVSNAGAWGLFGPSVAAANYLWRSRGSAAQVDASFSNASVAAPITNVLTGLGDISGDSAILRVNGTQVAQSTADQGTGNYLTYTHFIGRRGGTSLPANMRLYQLITRYGPNLTADQIAQVETFVNQRTGAF